MSPILKRILIGAAVVVVTGLVAMALLGGPGSGGDDEEAGGPAGGGGPGGSSALVVDAHIVEPVALVDGTLTTGSLLANESVQLRPEVSGRLVELALEEGAAVSEGTLLARINDSELQARLRELEARRRVMEQREFRQARLLEEGGVSAEELEETRAELEAMDAEAQVLRSQIEQHEIRAPFDGRLGLRQVSPGSYVSPETVIASLSETDPIRLQFTVPARHADRVGEGSSVRFRVEGFDEDFEAVIHVIDPALEEGTRTLRLRARTPNPEGRLRVGSFATVEVVFQEIEEALTVPSIAVRPDLEGPQLWVYRGGEAERVGIETGIRTAASVQVLSGISAGDTVITTGFGQLRPGREVEVADLSEGRAPGEPAGDLLDEVAPDADLTGPPPGAGGDGAGPGAGEGP